MCLKTKRKRLGLGSLIFGEGWKTFVVGPPGQSGGVCLHPWLAAFAYPTNDVVQTSHAEKERKPMQNKLNNFCSATKFVDPA